MSKDELITIIDESPVSNETYNNVREYIVAAQRQITSAVACFIVRAKVI